jgi:hypothetical protein
MPAMNKHLVPTLSALVLLAFPLTSFALIRPSFQLEACTWEATHIVVVNQACKTDIEVEVLESWKGNLKKGDFITIPDLAEFIPEQTRVVKHRRFWEDEDANLPTHVNGQRMVFFLIKDNFHGQADTSASATWKPAGKRRGGMDGMDVSMSWIEQGRAFAFRQIKNRGPTQLVSLSMTEADLKERVAEVVKGQKNLVNAIDSGDQRKMADALFPLLRNGWNYSGYKALELVGRSGKEALPLLSRVLLEEASDEWCYYAVAEMKKINPEAVGPVLTEVMMQELAFWKCKGPTLNSNWAVGVDEDELDCLRCHHAKVNETLWLLKDLRYEGCRTVVDELQNLWLLLPQLRVEDFDEVIRRCDQLLSGLPQEKDSE